MIDDAQLVELEQFVDDALARGDSNDLAVLGRGEISVVLGWPTAEPRWACKRLPPFADAAAADTYAATLHRYLAALAERSITVVDTDVRRVRGRDATIALYCVQPVLPAESLGVAFVRSHPERAAQVLADIVDAAGIVDRSVGLDGQLSNWAVIDDRLVYLDITTPMLRRPDGSSELDAEVFMASLPWVLRAPVRRFVLPGILARFHEPRSVVLDMAANLVKEHLDHLIPAVMAAAHGRFDPPLTDDEIRRDYRRDARTWSMLQGIRRADRWWQRSVRRRPYPFLLPEGIER